MVKRRLPASALKAATTIIVIQLVTTLIAAALYGIFANAKAAYSAGIGGGISILATIFFALQVFSARIGTPPDQIAQAFFVGEIIKIILTAVLFSIVIIWLPVSFLPLFLTYAAALLAHWLALPFTSTASPKRTP